ncbi:MAG: hypothetical protein QOC68_4568 [Solirubrobacteraceae bacterium]|jgi:hypothetical protein|nr:hypothetical protein [Solirubrobacteraceae bacterium]
MLSVIIQLNSAHPAESDRPGRNPLLTQPPLTFAGGAAHVGAGAVATAMATRTRARM